MSHSIDPETGRFLRLDPKEYFNSHYSIDENTGCWNWTGQKFTRSGYGTFKCKGLSNSPINASRASWILHKGKIDSRKIMVLHTCDNRLCVNPDHLFLGSGKENMQDCKQKGRLNIGENRPQSKLTEDNVREARQLRQLGWPWKKLAKKFNVSGNCIGLAVMGLTWSHVDEPIPTFYRKPNWKK